MKVPEGVNFIQFYQSAKEQGVTITSREVGVIFNLNGNRPCWMARAQCGGKTVYLGRFPFTRAGEIAAGKKFNSYMESIGKEKRYSEKRIRKRNLK